MMVVADIDDAFVPLSNGCLVNLATARTQIETLLDQIPQMFAGNRVAEACMGSAVQAASGALKNTGGRIIVLQTCLPTVGVGALKSREDPKLYGTDKEKTLFEPQGPQLPKLAVECSNNGVGVDLFLFPSAYIDVATIGISIYIFSCIIL
jgi:protein transport protein SEC24